MRTAIVVLLAFALAPAVAAQPAEDELRRTFERFVAAQNEHDLDAVRELLLDSPDFLWITRGQAIWGREAALQRFAELYRGTWRLEPEPDAFRVVAVDDDSAQILATVEFSIGPPGEPAQPARFLLNQTLARVGGTWRIASILPIPVPPPSTTPPPAASAPTPP